MLKETKKMLKETKEFQKGDVYLAEYGNKIVKLTIYEICGTMVRHQYGWEDIQDFVKRIKARYGVQKHFWFMTWISRNYLN